MARGSVRSSSEKELAYVRTAYSSRAFGLAGIEKTAQDASAAVSLLSPQCVLSDAMHLRISV